MKQKRLLPLFLCLCLLFVLPVKVSAADNSEQETSVSRGSWSVTAMAR